MKKICNQCQTEMIENCKVNVQYGAYGITIKKKGKRLFSGVSAEPKAAVCPNCGCVILYIDDYEEFKE
jgi:hypothetical protein